VFSFSQLPPLGLYIHIPWCVRKCPYCDFNSHEARLPLDESAYIDALIRDLEQELPQTWGRRVVSIYIGGGTPSLISPTQIGRLISQIRARLNCIPGIEISLEANPGTINPATLSGLREAGINRLSIGVQSFDNTSLQQLGRIHDEQEARNAVDAAREAGFSNMNLDLMFGLPQQSMAMALDDLSSAIDLAPTHLSLYQLTIEPNTVFHVHPPSLPEEDMIWEMQQALHDKLKAGGYLHYEVSAFSRPGSPCQHNQNYWQFGDYIGIGAGAHGKITTPDEVRRYWKLKQPKAYMDHAGSDKAIGGQHTLNRSDMVFEFMLNAMRLRQGFSPALFQAHTGLPVSAAEPALHLAEEKKLITWTPTLIQPTELGHRFLNDLLQLFLHCEEPGQNIQVEHSRS